MAGLLSVGEQGGGLKPVNGFAKKDQRNPPEYQKRLGHWQGIFTSSVIYSREIMGRRIHVYTFPRWTLYRWLKCLLFYSTALPRHDPIITGLLERYEDGDFVSLNCTTDMSSPAAVISWFINGESVYHEYQMPYHEEVIEAEEFQLKARSLELHFHIDKFRHFQSRSSVEVKCLARVEGINSVPARESVKYLALRQDDLTNQKLTTNFRRNSSPSMQRIRDSLQVLFTLLIIYCR